MIDFLKFIFLKIIHIVNYIKENLACMFNLFIISFLVLFILYITSITNIPIKTPLFIFMLALWAILFVDWILNNNCNK